ncbi:cell division protein [Streptomyces sp. SID4919]|uniref:HNH endonuclease signature motif containing protein n=1 Tax=unclassified Streptomyces TaxID=2593676 RepID=UPI00136E9FD0|nr:MULTISPECIES: HNH endonuclease signature motif containing protein [unclassified Streptomyces]MYY10047.1 cell division protein [Streptomyces sp. SID4919]
MESTSRGIPDPIKREVRQRCGFGCIFCGIPIYEYDHIRPWSEVKCHEAENLTLLCPLHHSEKTKGLLPVESVREKNSSPRNTGKTESPAHSLHFRGAEFKIHMGSVQFTQKLSPERRCDLVEINGQPLLSVRVEGEENLLLSLTLRDAGGGDIVRILDNELQYALDSWDVEFSGNSLTIRRERRNILARISFRPPKILSIAKGHFLADETSVSIDRNGISCFPGNQRIDGGIWGGEYRRGIVAWGNEYSPDRPIDASETFLLIPPGDP